MTPLQRTYAITREATDAQQDVIREMRELCVERAELREAMRHMVRLDDPVVTGLVEASKKMLEELSSMGDGEFDSEVVKALSAYEARVKEVSRE